MARPCKVKLKKHPITGKEVYPALGDALIEKFPSMSIDEITKIFNYIFTSEFYEFFGGKWYSPEERSGFEDKVDEEGFPKIEYVVEFKEKIVDNRVKDPKKKWYKKETQKKIKARTKYVEMSLDSLEKQISRMKKTSPSEEKKQSLENLKSLRKLLDKYTERSGEKGFIRFLEHAAEYSAGILDAFEKVDKFSQLEWSNPKIRNAYKTVIKDWYDFISNYGGTAQAILKDWKQRQLTGKDDIEADGLDIITEDELEYLEQIVSLTDEIEMKYVIVSKNIVAHTLAPHFRAIEFEYRKDFEKEFEEKNPVEGFKDTITTKYTLDGKQVKADEWKLAQDIYVTEEVAKIKEQIYDENVEHIKTSLTTTEDDIDSWERWVDGISRQRDSVLQLIGEHFDVIDDKIRQDFISLVIEIKPLVDKAIDKRVEELGGVRVTKGTELWDPYIEREREDGKTPTRHFVAKYHSDFYKELNEMWRESTAEGVSVKEGKAIRRNWFKANMDQDSTYRALKIKDAKNNYRTRRAEEYAEKQKEKGYDVHWPRDQWLNDDYKKLVARGNDDPVYILYKRLIDIQAKSDERVAADMRLGTMILQDRKSYSERLTTEGKTPIQFAKAAWIGIKEEIKNAWLVREVDEFAGEELSQVTQEIPEEFDIEKVQAGQDIKEVIVGAEGKERRYIPVHGRFEVPLEHMSFNIVDLVLKNHYITKHHEEYNKALPEIKMIEEHLKTRRVSKKDGYRKLVDKATKSKTELLKQSADNPGTSNAYKLVEDFIDQRVYKISAQGLMAQNFKITSDKVLVDTEEGTVKLVPGKEVPMHKIVNNIGKYGGAVLLQGNYLAMGANRNFGRAMAQLDAVGGHYWGINDLAIAYYRFVKDVPSILNDVGKVTPSSLTGLILQKYDALNSFHPSNYNFGAITRMGQVVDPDSLWATIHLPEYMNHGIPVMAFLQHVKVYNKSGELLLRNKGTTKDINKAMSLLESMSKDEKGRLVIDDRVAYTTIDHKTDPRKTEFISRALVRPTQLINEDNQGQYAWNNKMAAQFRWWGALLRAMRGFQIPGSRKRWDNVGKIWNKEEREPNINNFQGGKNVDMDGDYVTTILFLKNLIRDFTRFNFKLRSMGKKEWNALSAYERHQVRRTISEIGYFTIAGILGNIFKAAADEEDELIYYYMSFYANRLHSELQAYSSTEEFWRIVKSPAVSVTMAQRIQRVLSQWAADSLGADMERYVSGHRKGQTKMRYRLRDVIPWWKHTEKHKEMKEALEYYYRNVVW